MTSHHRLLGQFMAILQVMVVQLLPMLRIHLVIDILNLSDSHKVKVWMVLDQMLLSRKWIHQRHLDQLSIFKRQRNGFYFRILNDLRFISYESFVAFRCQKIAYTSNFGYCVSYSIKLENSQEVQRTWALIHHNYKILLQQLIWIVGNLTWKKLQCMQETQNTIQSDLPRWSWELGNREPPRWFSRLAKWSAQVSIYFHGLYSSGKQKTHGYTQTHLVALHPFTSENTLVSNYYFRS